MASKIILWLEEISKRLVKIDEIDLKLVVTTVRPLEKCSLDELEN